MPFSRRIPLIFVGTRIAIVLIGMVAMRFLPMDDSPEHRRLPAHPALDMWFRWDAGIYTGIALYGAGWYTEREVHQDAAFMPLYPQMIRATNALIGCADRPCTRNRMLPCDGYTCATISGLVISNVALLLGMLLVYQITQMRFGEVIAQRTLWLLMLSPGSIFLSGVYTEALFVCLCALTIYLITVRQALLLAALAACAAVMTRVVGVALCIPLLWYAWRQPGWRRISYMLIAVLPVATVIGYFAYMDAVVGHAGVYTEANRVFWYRGFKPVWATVWAYFYGKERTSLWGPGLAWIDLAFMAIYLALGVIAVRKDRAMGTFALAAILIPLISGNLASMLRYGCAVFPLTVALAHLGENRAARIAIYAASVVLAIVIIVRFATWRFMV